jgi:hypothetical protein
VSTVRCMRGLIYGRAKLADGSSERFAVEPDALEETLQRLMQGGDWLSNGERRWVPRIVEIQVGEPVDPVLREELRSRLEDFHGAISVLQSRAGGFRSKSQQGANEA